MSIGQYQTVCKSFVKFAELIGEDSYTRDLCDRYLAHLDKKVDNQEICSMYRRFQRRVMEFRDYLIKVRKAKEGKCPCWY